MPSAGRFNTVVMDGDASSPRICQTAILRNTNVGPCWAEGMHDVERVTHTRDPRRPYASHGRLRWCSTRSQPATVAVCSLVDCRHVLRARARSHRPLPDHRRCASRFRETRTQQWHPRSSGRRRVRELKYEIEAEPSIVRPPYRPPASCRHVAGRSRHGRERGELTRSLAVLQIGEEDRSGRQE